LVKRYIFSSESVTEGHPDKICDQISDSILDALLKEDEESRVAAEVVVNTGLVLITGEITSKAQINFVDIARKKIAEIGYTDADNGFSANSCAVMVTVDKQSPDIGEGVTKSQEKREEFGRDNFDIIGAGDQGIVFGYACNETPELMPLPISLAHRLARRLAEVRKSGLLEYLRPDGKTQVSIQYEDGRPVGVDTILISTQHDETIDGIADNEQVQARIKADLWEHVVKTVFQDLLLSVGEETRFLVNPTGKFVIGGPQGDSGLTGRKIIVDTYGGYSRHGGGAFSGKDPTKVDRSAAYACRHIAKNIVAAGLAEKCEVQVGYAIGVARPVSVFIETFGTGKISDAELLKLVEKHFELRPAGIISRYNLRRLPKENNGRFYQNVAAYGHFGRTDLDLPWERLEFVEHLKGALSDSFQGAAN